MYLPYDEAIGVYKQDDHFLDRKPWPAARGGAHDPLLLRFHPLVLYRHQVCKQADAVLAMFLQEDMFAADARRRTFHHYEALTVHDSALSPGAFGIVAARLGEAGRALAYTRRTLLLDLHDLHGNTRDGLHMAALGAGWMCLAFGFAGLRVADGGLNFRPMAGAPPFSLRIQYRGRGLEIASDGEAASYRLAWGPPLRIEHSGLELQLVEGQGWVRAPVGAEAKSAC
jgi:alpha,alpha-trehalose phosphorylase